jgi:hypothetical protein
LQSVIEFSIAAKFVDGLLTSHQKQRHVSVYLELLGKADESSTPGAGIALFPKLEMKPEGWGREIVSAVLDSTSTVPLKHGESVGLAAYAPWLRTTLKRRQSQLSTSSQRLSLTVIGNVSITLVAAIYS